MNIKVQKKLKNASIYSLTMLEQENIRQSILEIFTDYVLFFRIQRVMFQFQNVFNPSKKMDFEWDADNNYSGYASVINLLNICDEYDLNHCLSELTYNYVINSNEDAKSVSEKLYTIWEGEINNYFLTKNKI